MTDYDLRQSSPKRHYAWTVVLTGAFAIFCGLGLGRFAFGMILPTMSNSLELNYSQSGLLGFANLLGYLVAVILVPMVLRKFGTRIATTAGLAIISLSMLGIAWTEHFLFLCLLYCLTGIGSASVVLPTMSLISQWFQPSHRGLAAGIAMSGPGFGIILTGFIVPLLIPFHNMQSWQTGWLIFAAITGSVAIIAFVLIRNHPEEVGHLPYGRAPRTPPTTQSLMPRATRFRLLAHMGLVFIIYGATYMLYVTFIVTSMVNDYQMNETDAGSLWAWFGFFSIFSGILFGWISDKIGRRAGMAVSFAVLAIAYLLVGTNTWILGLYVSVVLFGIAAWSVPVIMAASAGDYFGSAAAANALAALTIAFSTGQALGPIIAGFLAENSGNFDASYTGSGIAALVAIALISVLKVPSVSK